MEKLIINEDCNYFHKRKNYSIKDYSKCLERYSSNFEKEISLTTETPIFLDANILLRYYNISYNAREKFLEFIKLHSERIIISKQVQYEFIKNRESSINKFFEQVTKKIPKDFNSEIINGFKSFLDSHKTVLKDYPEIELQIGKHKDELEKIFQNLNGSIEKKKSEHLELLFHDEFLDVINSCKFYSGLEVGELSIICNHFESLKKETEGLGIDNVLNKNHVVFPGYGDIKLKPQNPYGDYIIYHEMIKYSLENQTNLLFLTFDNSKGDWMSKSKSPYIHYIQNFFSNTEQLLFIVDAERTLEEILKVNVNSLIEQDPENSESSELSSSDLDDLIESSDIFTNRRIVPVTSEVLEELRLAGYSTIQQIDRDLRRGQAALEKYEKDHIRSNFNCIGVIRVTLQIVNPNYTHVVSRNGSISLRSQNSIKGLNKYRKYSNL